MTKPIPKLALKVAAKINGNVADVDAGRITWAEFSARQRAAWGEVDRGELPIIGSACSRRMLAVQAALRTSA